MCIAWFWTVALVAADPRRFSQVLVESPTIPKCFLLALFDGTVPLVSVVIPARGQAALLRRTLATVQAQTFQNLEVIVIDDGSMPPLAQDLADLVPSMNIRYHHQPAAGPGMARNRGVEMAEGEFVAFLDSDDLWAPDKLQLQVDTMRRDLGADLCVTQETLVDGDDRPFKRNARRVQAGVPGVKAFRHVMIHPSALMMRRRLFDDPAHRFWDQPRYCEDWNLWMKLAFTVKIAVVPDCLTFIRKVSAGRATNNGQKLYEDGKFAVDDALAFLARTGISPRTIRRCRRAAERVLTYHYFSFLMARRDYPSAMKMYRYLAGCPWSAEFAKASAKLLLYPTGLRTPVPR